MSLTRFLRDILPALAWMSVIFTLSTHAGSSAHTNSLLNTLLARFLPGLWHRLTWPELDGLHYYVRKAAHVTEYTVLGILMLRAFRVPPPAVRAVLYAWTICTFYAATDEFHQVFVPGRTPKVTDVLLDASGATLGIALYRLFAARRHAALAPAPHFQV